ncbi:MAG TPA: hypothetical protein VFN10_05755 [Thermoanaerobaculia bacterium]|nr:hypothetical protein [Thermoanaerobaculia bacterium]
MIDIASRSDATAMPLQRRSRDGAICTVFTALDCALFDFDTFQPTHARALLRELRESHVAVIPVSVMTLAELEPVARKLGFRSMIVEAGGAIARWNAIAWEVEPCGPTSDELLAVIGEIEERSGALLKVYSVMSDGDASLLSGRSGAMLGGSRQRQYSEPFLIESGDPHRVSEAAATLGYSIARGGRFLHLARRDAESAFSRLRDEMPCDVAIGVGASPIDADFLSVADMPIIVPRPDGTPDPELLARVPHAHIAPAPGSAGWAAAVRAVWSASVTRPHLRA